MLITLNVYYSLQLLNTNGIELLQLIEHNVLLPKIIVQQFLNDDVEISDALLGKVSFLGFFYFK